MLSVYIFRVQNDNEILLIYSLIIVIITRERESVTCVVMEERSQVRSVHFDKYFAIAGNNIHRRAAEKPNMLGPPPV